MFSNAMVDMVSSVSVLKAQFQNTSITAQPCRPPYASNHRLPWEEDESVCAVRLWKVMDPLFAFQFLMLGWNCCVFWWGMGR